MAKLKELLKGILTEKEGVVMPTSYDSVGDICIFAEFPDVLKKKEKKIGEAILKQFSNFKVVCKKTGKYAGTFRTPTLRILAGERRKTTLHKENGIRVKLHVEDVYFSPRLATERDRINNLVKKGEHVLVMFSGCAVYPVNIAKNTEAKEIMGVEINPKAHLFALGNLVLNKCKNIQLFKGDVKDVLPKIHQTFDRILMPLPKSAEAYLDVALPKLKKGGILHFYDFLNEKEFVKAKEKIHVACKRNKRKVVRSTIVKCGQYGPGVFRICVDARIK